MIELVVYIAIFAAVILAFLDILVVITQIEARENSEAVVNQESQYLLSTIQRYVEGSSLVDIPQDTGTSTLKLRMSASASDPTYIYASGTAVYLQSATGTAQALTSVNVRVTNITFTRRANAPGHDSVAVAFTITPAAASWQAVARTLNFAIARVSAATFDSNLIPSSTATYKIGVSGQIWSSVNDALYFSGSNVGVGVANPSQVFEVTGGDMYNNTAGKGIILKSPGGSCFEVTINNSGNIATSTVSPCPA